MLLSAEMEIVFTNKLFLLEEMKQNEKHKRITVISGRLPAGNLLILH